MDNFQLWNTYYVTNNTALGLLKTLRNAPESDKKKIQDSIIKQLSYLVYKRIRGYKNNYFYSDLIQEGRIGLLKAINEFDPIRGLNFFKFAIWHIQHRINMYMRTYKKVSQKEISKNVINEEKDQQVMNPHELFEKYEIIRTLRNVIHSLPKIESDIMKMRYGLYDSPMCTFRQIGEVFSVSKQYVQQVESQVMNRLKTNDDILKFCGSKEW